MHKQDEEDMRKFGKNWVHAPGLAFKREGRKLLFCLGGFGFWKRELGYTFVFWRRVQLVDTVGETLLYTKCKCKS